MHKGARKQKRVAFSCMSVQSESRLADAVEALGCAFEQPVSGEDIYVVRGFARRFGLDPDLAQRQLREDYPHRSGTEPIEWGQPQWVRGDHVALRYRGNALAREKMWFQCGDPKEGFVKYYYTGWQKKVLSATSDVSNVPFLDKFVRDVNGWLLSHGQRSTNHFIVTAYEREDCGIGLHSDKEKSIYDDSVILVVKTGECGRPFVITENKRDEADPDRELFNCVVPPGDAVLMSMKANLKTKHGVPILKQPTGVSGSIVLRSIRERVEWDALAQELAKDAARAAKKRAHSSDA